MNSSRPAIPRHARRAVVVAALVACATSAHAAATLRSHDLFLTRGHVLQLAAPARAGFVTDTIGLDPTATDGSALPVFRTSAPLGPLLAQQGESAAQLTNGFALLYVRPAVALPSCATVTLVLRGATSGTEVSHTVAPHTSIRARGGAIALPFRLVSGAAAVAGEALDVAVALRIEPPCRATSMRLQYDSRGRPSRVTLAACTAPPGSPDVDGNGVPDVCENPLPPDDDEDGDDVPNGIDDCPFVANADQQDGDHDGIGDACDDDQPPGDADGDGIPDDIDDCPAVADPGQADADGDGIGDACEPGVADTDADGDGIPDRLDDCPRVPNADQLDADHDGVGDVCECALPGAGRCIAGGGSRRTDCLAEFNTPGPIVRARSGRVRPVLRCRDGDTTCDRDGRADGTCTFAVSVCLANRDPRLPRCTPQPAAQFAVVATPDVAARGALEAATASLQRQVRTLGVGAPADTCTAPVAIHVAAPRTGHGVRRRRLRTATRAASGGVDRDVVRLECGAMRGRTSSATRGAEVDHR